MKSFKQYLHEVVNFVPGRGNVFTPGGNTPAVSPAPGAAARPSVSPLQANANRQQRRANLLAAVRRNPSQELRNMATRNAMLTTASAIFGSVSKDPETGEATYTPGLLAKARDAFEAGKAMQGVDVQRSTIPIAGRATQGLLSRIANVDISAPRRPANPPVSFTDRLRRGLRNFLSPSYPPQAQTGMRSMTPLQYNALLNASRSGVQGLPEQKVHRIKK